MKSPETTDRLLCELCKKQNKTKTKNVTLISLDGTWGEKYDLYKGANNSKNPFMSVYTVACVSAQLMLLITSEWQYTGIAYFPDRH